MWVDVTRVVVRSAVARSLNAIPTLLLAPRQRLPGSEPNFCESVEPLAEVHPLAVHYDRGANVRLSGDKSCEESASPCVSPWQPSPPAGRSRRRSPPARRESAEVRRATILRHTLVSSHDPAPYHHPEALRSGWPCPTRRRARCRQPAAAAPAARTASAQLDSGTGVNDTTTTPPEAA